MTPWPFNLTWYYGILIGTIVILFLLATAITWLERHLTRRNYFTPEQEDAEKWHKEKEQDS